MVCENLGRLKTTHAAAVEQMCLLGFVCNASPCIRFNYVNYNWLINKSIKFNENLEFNSNVIKMLLHFELAGWKAQA